MMKASVSDLRYRFGKLQKLLRQGQEIKITKRGRVIATLVPAKKDGASRYLTLKLALKKIFGNRKMSVSGAELIAGNKDLF